MSNGLGDLNRTSKMIVGTFRGRTVDMSLCRKNKNTNGSLHLFLDHIESLKTSMPVMQCLHCDKVIPKYTDIDTPLSEQIDAVVLPRPSWHETWMSVARAMAERSYDPRLKVGAIVVSCDNTQMLSVGYNGNYRGGPHEHESKEPGKSGFVHAEVNSLVKCDFNFPKKKHMYVTHSPCRDCSKLIINAEIAKVIYEIPYRDTSGVDLLKSVGIDVMSLEDTIVTSK